MKPLMKSVAGIRGIVGETLTPEVIVDFTLAFSSLLKKGAVVIGSDTRHSRHAISRLVSGALLAAGRDVVDAGILPTPAISSCIHEQKFAGGIAITASHNPAPWNALKFFNADGIYLSKLELNRLMRKYELRSFSLASGLKTGVPKYDTNLAQRHIKKVIRHSAKDAIRKRRFKVVLDCCNGAGSQMIPDILDSLGCETIVINDAIDKPFPHDPEPLPEHLGELCRRVKAEGADIGFALDPDADRLAIIDESGNPISEERSIVLAAYYVLQQKRSPVVVNLSTTQAVDWVARKFGVRVYRTPIGESHVIQKMLKTDALIGGEGNGGVIFAPSHYGRDAAIGIGLILSLLAKKESTLSEMNREIPNYCMRKTRCPLPDVPLEKIFHAVKQHFHRMPDEGISFRTNTADGLKLISRDTWIHLRASATEPILRVYFEAPNNERIDHLEQALSKLLKEMTS